jgi:hypothetical protein
MALRPTQGDEKRLPFSAHCRPADRRGPQAGTAAPWLPAMLPRLVQRPALEKFQGLQLIHQRGTEREP